MKIKKLSQKKINLLLHSSFSYYLKYKDWISDCDDKNEKFMVQTYFNIEIPNRHIPLQEMHEIILNCKVLLEKYISENNLNFVGHMLIIHEFTQKFNWIAEHSIDDLLIQKSISYFQKNSGLSEREIICSHGFEYIGSLQEIVLEIFFLPFLQSYQDINILIFDQHYLFQINHHLLFSKIATLI